MNGIYGTLCVHFRSKNLHAHAHAGYNTWPYSTKVVGAPSVRRIYCTHTKRTRLYSAMWVRPRIFSIVLAVGFAHCAFAKDADLDYGRESSFADGVQNLPIGGRLPHAPQTRLIVIDRLMGATRAEELREEIINTCNFSWARHAYPGMWCRNKRSADLANRYTTIVNSRLKDLGISIKFDGRDSFFGLIANNTAADFSNAPHIDFHSSEQYAAVHYLFHVENASSASGGTAFFKDRTTGIQRYTSGDQCQSYTELAGGICASWRSSELDAKTTYMSFEDPWWDVLHVVAPKFDRLILYPSNQIHGAWMDKDAVHRFLVTANSTSGREKISTGRLTSNLFGRRSTHSDVENNLDL